jgi:hypothetical protein
VEEIIASSGLQIIRCMLCSLRKKDYGGMRNGCLGSEREIRIAERIKTLQADNLILQVVANMCNE